MKKLLVLFLSVIMVLSVVAPASAAATADPNVGPVSYAWVPKYTTSYVNPDGSVTECSVYGLSDAQKIAALAGALYPANQIEYELASLERHMDPDVARYETVFSGMGSLDSYLDRDSDTNRALGVVPYSDAAEMLTIVSKTEDYRNIPEVKYFVDSYLNQTLSGNQLRWGLKALMGYGYAGPDHEVSIDEMSVKNLITYAHQIIATEEFQALMAPLYEVRNGNADAYALTCRYTAEELSALWAKLAWAAQAYLPGQVQMLENMTFTVPVAVRPPLENSEGYGSDSGWAEACP